MIAYNLIRFKFDLVIASFNVFIKIPSKYSKYLALIILKHYLNAISVNCFNQFHNFNIFVKNAINILKHFTSFRVRLKNIFKLLILTFIVLLLSVFNQPTILEIVPAVKNYQIFEVKLTTNEFRIFVF